MRNMNKLVLALALGFAISPAYAGNDNGPSFFGDTTNNNQTYNQPTATGGTAFGGAGGDASSTAVGVGLGVGVGIGGSSNATGGSVGDIRNTNTNTAFGGAGGQGGTGIGLGGSAHQGQAQGQDQSQGQGQQQGQSNVNKSSTSTSTSTSTSSTNGQSQSANNAGNAQSISIVEENPDDITIRQAPGVVVTAPNATVSCYKTFGGSLSGILGGAGFSGGRIDEQCEYRETVRIAAAVDTDGAAKMLCLNQAYGIANPTKCAGVRPVYLLEGKAAAQYRANAAADAKK